MTPSVNVLMIDNLDSFTFNLVESMERLGAKVRVLRNSVSAEDALAAAEDSGAHLVLSPGPGRPEDAGCCLELIARAKGRVPLLGVCLGHQAMVLEAGGGTVADAQPAYEYNESVNKAKAVFRAVELAVEQPEWP